ncbi:hypothetical protein GCM10017562_50590 [Streptomyces roseofulvus]|uniref:Uncharacterized protein n=2 Tax=Streptomyces TaxID=1883 RepID=A0ABU4K654_9ACTN|nr:hypothetical protein [Streptomyces roseolus]MDX2293228.1 hypothetical protein [Streptomyces roseolus]
MRSSARRTLALTLAAAPLAALAALLAGPQAAADSPAAPALVTAPEPTPTPTASGDGFSWG